MINQCCKQKDYLKVSATFCALQILNALQSHPTDAATLSDAIIKNGLKMEYQPLNMFGLH